MTSITSLVAPQSRCRMGVSRVDITPPVGIYHRMWGAATHDQATGVHRPLLATSVALAPRGGEPRDGEPRDLQLLIALDHCLFGRVELQNLLDAVVQQTGLPRQSMMVVFSHTHAAGLLGLDRVHLPGGNLIPPYFEMLNQRVGTAAKRAMEQLEDVTLVYGSGHCNLAAHRDYWDEQTRQFVCGFNPGVPSDDTLMVARATNAAGKIVATFVNYACHPTTLAWANQLISPDYPGALREVVEDRTGAPCVFLQGASGELGPREGYVGDPQVADRNGRQVGFAALSAFEGLSNADTQFDYAGPVVSGATLGTWQYHSLTPDGLNLTSQWSVQHLTIPLEYRKGLPTIDELERDRHEWLAKEKQAHSQGDQIAARDCRAMVERQTRYIARLKNLPSGASFPYEVSIWRFGSAVWVALPGEPYNYIQRELRARHPKFAIMILSLAMGWGPSYLPTADVYDKGIYQESIALAAPGSLEKITDQIDRVLGNL